MPDHARSATIPQRANRVNTAMHTYNIQEAETHMSEMLSLALQGEEVVISKANQPLVKLTPIAAQKKKRVAGLHAGAIFVADDFDEPLPDAFWLGEEQG